MLLGNRGVYSPSKDEYFNEKVTSVNFNDDSKFDKDAHKLALYFKENDLTNIDNIPEDTLYFLNNKLSEYHSVLPYGSNDPWLNHGGINITIYGEGEFTRLGRFPLATFFNNRWIGSNSAHGNAFETVGFNHGLEIYPKIADPNDPNDDGMFVQGGGDPASFQAGDSVEWFYNVTGRNCWDKLCLGTYTGGWPDYAYIGLKNITCRTVIKIELLYKNNTNTGLKYDKVIIGDKEFDNWGLPFQCLYNDDGHSEHGGAGYHSFIYIHPKTNQVIVNDYTQWGINDLAEDLIFYDNESDTCPLLPRNPWYRTACVMPICANMDRCYLSPEHTLDESLRQEAEEYWNHDIAVAKTGAFTSLQYPYSRSDEKIWVGYWDTSIKLLETQESVYKDPASNEDFYLLTEENDRILL